VEKNNLGRVTKKLKKLKNTEITRHIKGSSLKKIDVNFINQPNNKIILTTNAL